MKNISSILKLFLLPGIVLCYPVRLSGEDHIIAGSANLPVPGGKRAEIVDIGTRLELFADDFLIGQLTGKAVLCLHHPEPKEIAIVHDAPWEGSGSGYHSIFKDGDIYRMYYKAWQLIVTPGKLNNSSHPLYCCYAESNDGIHWRKPDLGLYEFNGSTANNIVINSCKYGQADADAGHPAVFKDDNPDAREDERYKAIIRSNGQRGLLAFKSLDGIHWSPMSDRPVITDGAFDSQNLAFWDGERREYRAYWRYFTEGISTGKSSDLYKGIRAIRTATSKDFINWENQADLKYTDSPVEHLYTNQVKPYFRAPHIFIGFPSRYIERGWSGPMRQLPDPEHREWRAAASLRYGTALTEALLMVSRDGVTFKRWNEAFLRPGIERKGTWNYGNQYMAWSMVTTKSAIEGAPDELSFYAVEDYWTGKGSALRRYTLRIDGFVSVSAPMQGGELVTRSLTFAGNNLVINFSTSAAGGIQVEIDDEHGKALPGFSLDECPVIFGDSSERVVSWKTGSDLSALKGRPVKLLFLLKDADLYSLRFK
jgi:hypothetical protein